MATCITGYRYEMLAFNVTYNCPVGWRCHVCHIAYILTAAGSDITLGITECILASEFESGKETVSNCMGKVHTCKVKTYMQVGCARILM